MKYIFCKTWFVFLLTLAGSIFQTRAVTLTVTPSVTSNLYAGFVTLNIGGLTNTEKVTVQKWLDLNANGTIDPGEALVDAFRIADGEAMVIGGVTNVSAVYDSGSTPGAITTSLNFAPPISLENTVGQFIYRVISSNSATATATFTVTNSATAQAVTGTIYSNGVAPLPNAVMVALTWPDTSYMGAAVADSNGNYYLNLPPGSYALISAVPGYYTDQSQLPLVTLTNGMISTNNLFETNGGPTTVSGSVYDATNASPIPGAFLQFQSGSLFAIGFSDASGNYSAALTPSFWKIQPEKERLARRTYVVPSSTIQVDTTTGSVANVGVALPKGNALFYGRIADSSNNPFANVKFNGDDDSQANAVGYADANGNYGVAVLGDTNDTWFVSPDSSENIFLNNYIVNIFSGTNIAFGQAIRVDFTVQPGTARVTGHVTDNSGNPVGGVPLYAGQVGAENQSFSSRTDNSGNYSLPVRNGQWDVVFVTSGNETIDKLGLEDLFAPHELTVPPTNNVVDITLYPFGTPLMSQPQRISSSQFGFNVNGSNGVNYTVQVSTNLGSTNWLNLYSFQLTTNPFPIVDTQATNSPRFYRVQKN